MIEMETQSLPSIGENGVVADGRDAGSGRFIKGWKGGKGNPIADRVHQFRRAMVKSVTSQDVRDVLATLLKAAKEGDVPACKEFLDRTVGKVRLDADDERQPDLTAIQVVVRFDKAG